MPAKRNQSSQADGSEPTNSTTATGSRYTVVARRYRPRGFDELIGQQNVAAALKTAIDTNRVGHAYLFTGARGVGKTSTARIFAKALNTAHSTAGRELIVADLAEAIDSGEDMDVIEIDGASNRGIEEIRTLRANATVRPSRARYKIYIIDEVHMLTIQAFNALLKTLEEPPEHVKFIFCTTDPEKIPITVLSRCQRFDFAPIKTDQIQARLAHICDNEQVTADPDALRLIARRANGSMRDSQSLLEQILSFAEGNITVDTVHTMLGTADDSRLEAFANAMIHRDAGTALQMLDDAVDTGVDAGQFAEQTLGYLRDLMALGVGASVDLMRTANPSDVDRLKEMTSRWGTMTLLAAIQILDETLVKMRHSVQSRILFEVAIVQICHLQDLQAIANLAQAIRDNAPLPKQIPSVLTTASSPSNAATIHEKKNAPLQINDQAHIVEDDVWQPSNSTSPHVVDTKRAFTHEPLAQPTSSTPATAEQATSLGASAFADNHNSAVAIGVKGDLLKLWRTATANLDGMLGDCASRAISIEPNQTGSEWEIALPFGSDFALQMMNEQDNLTQLRQSILAACGETKALRFRIAKPEESPRTNHTATSNVPKQALNQAQLTRHLSSNPLVSSLVKTLDAEVVRVDVPKDYTIDG